MILHLDSDGPALVAQIGAKILHFPPELFGLLRVSNREIAAAIIEGSEAHERAVAEGRSKRLASKLETVDPNDGYGHGDDTEVDRGDLRLDKIPRTASDRPSNQAVAPALTLLTDVTGSPSQTICSPSHLANILEARDTEEARKARQTVRRRDGGAA